MGWKKKKGRPKHQRRLLKASWPCQRAWHDGRGRDCDRVADSVNNGSRLMADPWCLRCGCGGNRRPGAFQCGVVGLPAGPKLKLELALGCVAPH